MSINFERSKSNTSVEWYTPPYIIRSLGKFDLDPATSVKAIAFNQSATKYCTKEDNGLEKKWFGRVWLNPPYSTALIKLFMKKMAEHNNGIALICNRADTAWFHDYVLSEAHSILYLRGRIKFFRPDGSVGNNPGIGNVLVAYGQNNTDFLSRSGLTGKLVRL